MKRNQKHERRVKKLIVGSFLCATVLAVSTYAWFIGMRTVNVSTFDVSIAAVDGLSLSLNGKDWADTVTINSENYNDTDVVYDGNTNSWGGTGLVPMSSIGKIDTTSSRLILFEKGSVTTTPGGFRLMASQVKNNGATELSGYVAFDLFVKNLSGHEYYTDLDPLNEEAIYLTLDSEVKVGSAGVENTGIENSVRVAFAQIGRVISTVGTDSAAVAKITGIKCGGTDTNHYYDSTTGVTSICTRDAQIWEPNDTNHVQNAINWYSTSCLKRTGSDVFATGSYKANSETDFCGKIKDGESYDTYAVAKEITVGNKVDIYDGTAYNSYTDTVGAGKELYAYPYFTDTMKEMEGTQRPTFLTLAPNSITKVRVYVWIEGQDVDNYDFASLGKQISVAFGLTKDRYYGSDVNYDSTGTAQLPESVVHAVTITEADETQLTAGTAGTKTYNLAIANRDSAPSVRVAFDYTHPGLSIAVKGDTTATTAQIEVTATNETLEGEYWYTVQIGGVNGTRRGKVVISASE